MHLLARGFAILLLVVHVGLAVWALVGFVEWFSPQVPWKRVSNPELPRPMQLLQWCLLLLAAAAFIGGYAARWRHTPEAMAVIYGAMAATCAWQTFAMLTHDARFRQMGIEYAEYAAILAFLFLSKHMAAHYGRA